MTEIVSLPTIDLTPGPATSDSANLPAMIRGGVITIGNFDGVHRGHAALLSEVRRMATVVGGPAVAVVLDPHPASILRPEQPVTRLTTIRRRAELMGPLGIDALVVCETTRQFLGMTAAEFFQMLVVDRLGANAIVEGPNFFFGRDRGGDIGVLQQLCSTHGVGMRIVQPTREADEMISSTRIRRLLESGDVRQAARLLAAPYRIAGTVTAGDKRGRKIGFPTANLAEIGVVIPAAGVYGGIATVASQSDPPWDVAQPDRSASGLKNTRSFSAAIHIGPNPTFESDGDLKVEVHLLDYDGDLYDQVLLVDFIVRVRDIARFDSTDRLVEQIDQDIQTIRSHLAPSDNR